MKPTDEDLAFLGGLEREGGMEGGGGREGRREGRKEGEEGKTDFQNLSTTEVSIHWLFPLPLWEILTLGLSSLMFL